MENERKVTVEQGKEFADQYGMKFFETSAKISTNVSDAFIAMTKEIMKSSGKKPVAEDKKPTVLGPSTGKDIQKTGCC